MEASASSLRRRGATRRRWSTRSLTCSQSAPTGTPTGALAMCAHAHAHAHARSCAQARRCLHAQSKETGPHLHAHKHTRARARVVRCSIARRSRMLSATPAADHAFTIGCCPRPHPRQRRVFTSDLRARRRRIRNRDGRRIPRRLSRHARARAADHAARGRALGAVPTAARARRGAMAMLFHGESWSNVAERCSMPWPIATRRSPARNPGRTWPKRRGHL